MQGLVERDRLVFMDMLPEDLREDVQKAFQLRQARKWGGNAPLEGLAALEAMPDPDQAAPFKNIGFSEKVRLLSAMSPAQVSAILGGLIFLGLPALQVQKHWMVIQHAEPG